MAAEDFLDSDFSELYKMLTANSEPQPQLTLPDTSQLQDGDPNRGYVNTIVTAPSLTSIDATGVAQWQFDGEGFYYVGFLPATHLAPGQQPEHELHSNLPLSPVESRSSFSNLDSLLEDNLEWLNEQQTSHNTKSETELGPTEVVCAGASVDKQAAEPHIRSPSASIQRNRALLCNNCGKAVAGVANFQRHLNSCQRNYVCKVCNASFARNWDLSRHVLTHSKPDAHCCAFCGKTFNRKDHLAKHLLVHNKEEYLESHKKDTNIRTDSAQCKVQNSPYSLACHVCNKSFRRPAELLSHVVRHSVNKPYGCDKCKQSFSYLSSLIRHTRLHEKSTGNGILAKEVTLGIPGEAEKSEDFNVEKLDTSDTKTRAPDSTSTTSTNAASGPLDEEHRSVA